MTTKRRRASTKKSVTNFKLKPLAQAVTLVTAGMAGNSVYAADVCVNPGSTTTINTNLSPADNCFLDTGENLDVTLNGAISFQGTGFASPGIAAAATGGTVAGSITNAGTIRGIVSFSNPGNTSIDASVGYGIRVINSSQVTGITNNAGIIEGIAAGTAANTSPVTYVNISNQSAYGIAIDNTSQVSGGITNNNGIIAGILTATVYGESPTVPGSATDLELDLRSVYGIFWDGVSTLSGGLINSGDIKGHAIADAFVKNVSSAVSITAFNAYGIYTNGFFNDGGVGISNNGGLISGKAVASIVNTSVTTSVFGGSISAYDAYGIYLRNNSDVTGSLINSGSIEAVASGEHIISGMLPTATTMSRVIGDAYVFARSAYGLYFGQAEFGGLFDNSGTVSGTVDLDIEINNFKSIGTAYASGYSGYGIALDGGGIDNSGFGGSFTNSGTISGDVEVNVALNNVKSVTGAFSAYAYYGYGIYGNNAPIGTTTTDHFTNSGNITGKASATADWDGANGTFSGAYASAETAYGISLSDSPIAGSLINSGTISGDVIADVNILGDTAGNALGSRATAQVYYAYGLFLVNSGVGGDLTNNMGSITASADATVTLENLKSVTNYISAFAITAYGLYANVSNITGTLTNSGTISSEVLASINLTNIDTIGDSLIFLPNVYATAYNAYGLLLNTSDVDGGITNTGTISGLASATIELDDVNNFTASFLAPISAYATTAYGVRTNNASIGSDFDNSGSISGTAEATIDIQNITGNFSRLFASATYAYGVSLSGSPVTGSLTNNAGSISAQVTASISAVGATSTSSPSAVGSRASASALYGYGLSIRSSDISGALTNDGTISAALDASIHLENLKSAWNNITATATYAYGIYMDSTDLGGALTNTGTISGEGNADITLDNVQYVNGPSAYVGYAYGLYARGAFATQAMMGSITNDGGLIQGIASASIQITDVTEFNGADATISSAYGIWISLVDINGGITNSGTISAIGNAEVSITGKNPATATGYSASAYAYYGYGINIEDTNISGDFDNSGTIEGVLNASVHLMDLKSYSDTASASAYTVYGVLLYSSDIDGAFSNSGTITGSADASLTLDNIADITHDLSAYANYAYGVYGYYTPIGTTSTDNFTNDGGTISGSITASVDVQGITAGSPSVSASVYSAYGVLLTNSPVAGNLVNSGIISAEATASVSVIGATTTSSPAVQMDSAYAFAYYGHGLYLAFSDIGGSLTNDGTISASLNASVHLENMDRKTSSFSVSATDAYGIYFYRSEITEGLTNTGTISGEAIADITLKNVQYATSYLSVSASYAYGIYARGISALTPTIIGSITNNGGTITGRASATVDITDIRAFYSPSATARFAYGIHARYTDVGGISNTGTISGEAIADISIIGKNPTTAIGSYVSASAYRAYGLYRSSSDISGSLSNDGTISAFLDASIHLEDLMSVASRISASASEAYGIYLNSSDIDVNLANTGTISGEAYADITLRNVEDVNNRIEAEASHAYGFYAFDALIDGSITNTSALTMEGTASATVDVTGITDFNSAFATGHSAFGIAMTSSSVTGSLTNTGTLSAMVNADVSITGQNPSTAVGNYANAIATEAYGVAIEDFSAITGNLENNSGTIQANALAKLDVQAVVVNSAFATASNIAGIRNDASTIMGNLVNDSGTISAIGDADVNLKQAGSGTNGFTFYARAKDIWGIKQDDLSTIDGNINNSGVIQGIATATLHGETDGTSLIVASASGSVYATANVDGINMQDGATINSVGADYGLENSGTILGQATATAAVSGFSAYAGVRAEGVDVNGTGTTLTKGINNSGLIKGSAIANYFGALGTADADGIGIRIYNNGVIDGDINNTGTIEGIATATNSGGGGATAAGFGFLIQTGSLTGSIVNSAGGVISGTTHGISITNNASGSVTIVNEGEDLLGNRSTISSIYIDTGEGLDISGLGGITGEITGGGGNLTISGDGFTLTDDISGFFDASIDDLATLDLDENATSLTVTNNLTFGSQLNIKTTINELGDNGSVSLALSGTLTEPTAIDMDIDASAAVLSLADPPYTLIDAGTLTAGIVLNTPTDDNIGFDFNPSIIGGDLVVTVVNVPNFVIPDGVEEVALLDFDFDSITIGAGSSGVLNQESGTITTDVLTIDAGGIFTQLIDDGMGGFILGTGVLNGGVVTLGAGASLILANQGTGVINGVSAGVGDLVFAGNYDTDSPIGGTNALNSILVKDGVTLTIDQNVNATTLTVGEGLSGVVNQIAGTVTVTDLIINAGGSYNQSGSGVLNASTSTITIATGGTLTLTNQGTGAIDGAGAGQGALVFAGNYNTDAPIGDTNSLASVSVNNGASLTLDQNLEAAVVTINGSLNQSAGTLATATLGVGTAANITQSGGTLTATNSTITGSINQSGGAMTLGALAINSGKTLTQTGGSLTAGAATLAGTATQSAGSMGVSSLSVSQGGSFTQSGSGVLSSGTLGISGTFNKGNNTVLAANTTINSGGLLMVTNGFNHNGNLNVSGGTVDVGGVTVNVDGTFNLGAGATLSTTVKSGATNDAGRITATGATTVSANANVDITVSPNAVVADGTTYKIIDGPAGGSGVNVPLTITDDSTELNFIASTDGSDLLLTAELAAVFGEAWLLGRTRSPNALAGFNALREFINSDPRLANAFASITTVEEFEAALQTLLPDVSRAIINITAFSGRSAVVSVINRLAAIRSGGVGFTGIAAGDHLTDIGIWLQGFGTAINQDDRQGIAGFDADTYGLSFGADTLISDNLRLGAAFSLAGTNSETNGAGKNLDVRNFQGTVYSSYQVDQHHLDASISYGNNSYNSSRLISVGTLRRRAQAQFNGDQVILQGQYGQVYTYDDDLVISPTAGLYYSNLDIDSYDETGAGTVNLSVVGQSYASLESILGVSVQKEIESRNGMTMVPEAHLSWRHEFLDEIQVNTSTYSGGGGSFITEGFTPASDSLNLGVSYSLYMQNNVDVKFSYDFETKSDYSSHSGLVNVRINF